MLNGVRSLAVLFLTIVAASTVQGQDRASSTVLGRIGDARSPASSVAGNLVPVPAGTTYYAQNKAYDFEGEGPPEDWCKGSQDPKCACQTGQQQSPVDMSTETLQASNITAELLESPYVAVLTPNYSVEAKVNVSNPGHGTAQINIAPDSPANTLAFGDRIFELVQIHFHSAAEHTFNGTRADLEAHLVHKDPETNGLAVFGVVFRRNGQTSDPLLAFTLENKPNVTSTDGNGKKVWGVNRVTTPVDLQALLAPFFNGHFLYYQGSLTTPPCTEGVQWFFFPRLLSMTMRQLADFEEYAGEQYIGTNRTVPENYRPTQPLYGRTVELY